MTASGFEQHSAQSPCPQAESDRQADTPTDMHAVITADFEALIRHRGYSRPTITLHARLADAFCRAMRVEGLTFGALDEASVTRLTADICRSLRPTVRRYAPHVLERFRDHLIEHAGAPPRALPAPDTSPRACLRRAYRCYLVEQRGLAPGTVDHCLRFHDRFLDHRFGAQGPDRMADLDGIHPGDITGFMLAIRRPDAARRDKTVPSYLRTFFRFLFWSGQELVADIGSAFLMARLGIAPRPLPGHADYLAGWMRALRGDRRLIFRAAAAAGRAADWLIAHAPGCEIGSGTVNGTGADADDGAAASAAGARD